MTDKDNDGLTFGDYLRPVWRFKYVVVLVVVAAAVATYSYYDRQARVYTTSTQLYVGQSDIQSLLGSGGSGTVRSITNQARLVQTPRVASVVKRRLDLPLPAEVLVGAVAVLPSPNSDFLTITATNTNAAFAADLTNGFAQAYLEVRRADLTRDAEAALKAAQSRLRNTRSGSSPAREALRNQITTLQGAVVAPPSPGEQISPAPVPSTPISPKPRRNAIFAAVLAFVLAIIVAYLLDRGDRRVRRLEDVETLFDLPILATVPRVRRPTPTKQDPFGTPPALREAHRTLRVNLDIARAQHQATVVMLTSALPAEGKSTIIRNLAISYREAGLRVAVIEADLRRPVLAERFGVDGAPGFGDALSLGVPPLLQRVPDAVEAGEDSSRSIDVIVAGTPTENPTVLLTTERVRPVVASIKADFDIVLVDTPPLLAVSDGLPLLGLVDAVVLVVRAGTTTQPAAERLRRTMERAPNVLVLGAVVNDVEDALAYYYGAERARPATQPAESTPAATATT